MSKMRTNGCLLPHSIFAIFAEDLKVNTYERSNQLQELSNESWDNQELKGGKKRVK